MAYGNEIWLGYDYVGYDKNAPKDFPRINSDGQLFEEFFIQFNDSLKNAHKLACESLNWEVIDESKRGCQERFVRNTLNSEWAAPASTMAFDWRKMVPFRLEVIFGSEMEFSMPNIPIGVPLSGRYYPTFLDYNNMHGTLPNPLTINGSFMDLFNIAKTFIVKEIPWLSNADMMLVEKHY